MNSVAVAGADPEGVKTPESVSGDLTIWGDVRFSADAFVQAHIRGDILAGKKLVLASTAEISGRVQGSEICLEGRVNGGLEASGQVWLKAGAWLRKRCVAQTLRIERGADFQGELRVGAVAP